MSDATKPDPARQEGGAKTRTGPAVGAPPTRTSSAFRALLAGAVVLTLLLVFILENTERVKVKFFGASGHLPLGVALLLAAVAGALVLGLVGAVRILQLRRRVRRGPRADRRAGH